MGKLTCKLCAWISRDQNRETSDGIDCVTTENLRVALSVPQHDHGDDHGIVPTTSKYKMHTTCEVQTTCSMSKMAVASVQTKSKCTKSLHCQAESTARESVSTQYTKAKSKRNELQKEFPD